MSNKVQAMSEPLLVLALVEVAATMAAGRGFAPARAATKAEEREAEWEEEDVDGNDDVESGATAATDDVEEGLVPFTAEEAEEAAAAAAANKRFIPLSMEPSPSSASAVLKEADDPAARFLISGGSLMFWIFSLLSSSALQSYEMENDSMPGSRAFESLPCIRLHASEDGLDGELGVHGLLRLFQLFGGQLRPLPKHRRHRRLLRLPLARGSRRSRGLLRGRGRNRQEPRGLRGGGAGTRVLELVHEQGRLHGGCHGCGGRRGGRGGDVVGVGEATFEGGRQLLLANLLSEEDSA